LDGEQQFVWLDLINGVVVVAASVVVASARLPANLGVMFVL